MPVDPTFLSWKARGQLGKSLRFIEFASDVNAHVPQHVGRRFTAAGNTVRKPVNDFRIVVLGVA